MGLPSWEDRIKRAEELGGNHAFARDPLNFYREVLIFQKSLYEHLSEKLDGFDAELDGSCPLHGGSLDLHLPLLLTFSPSFLALIKRAAPAELSEIADRLSVEGSDEFASLLEAYWSKQLDADNFDGNPALVFFPKAFLQPYAEFLADNHIKASDYDSEEVGEGAGPICPLCAGRPQLAVLKTEADGAKRMLLCSVCSTEWRFKRVCCPACGEEDFSKLSYHRSSEFPHVRVEVCESCHKYIKGIDLTAYGLAVPVVDEIAALPLDIWAAEQGYMKIEMNLVGV